GWRTGCHCRTEMTTAPWLESALRESCCQHVRQSRRTRRCRPNTGLSCERSAGRALVSFNPLLGRTSLGRRWRGTPLLGGNVGYGLGERPAVAPQVLHCVLPFAKGHVRRRLQDSRITPPGMLEVLVNVLDMNVQELAYFVGAWRPKLSTLAAQHNGALSDV